MKTSNFVVWAPRILGIVAAAGLASFALDAFDGRRLGVVLGDFVIHLLPAFVVAAVVALSWTRPWIGGILFVGMAAAYAASVPNKPDWILVISGPLVLIGVLYLVSWRTHVVS